VKLGTLLAERARKRFAFHPTQVVLFGYLALILSGAAILDTPLASADGKSIGFLNALFTATSAVCVTGLTVVDTATAFTDFGRAVILLLIQLGGLGIMAVAGLVGLTIFRRLSKRSSSLISTEFRATVDGKGSIREMVGRIALVVFAIEGVGALILMFWFGTHYQMSIGESIWSGVFHAVSAFNNAGFSLYTDNLMQFVSDPVVNLTIAALIIIGGLGFPVLIELRRVGFKPLKWTMHFKIVMVMTALLLVGGTVYIAILEWNNPGTLGALEPSDRVLAAFFQSVQTRTAGFNSIDISAMHTETWFGMDILMFIGAGPAGTGGGIKVTTFAVLLFIVITELRGDAAVNIFGKRLSRAVHRQAITIALLAVGVVMASTVFMQLVTDIDLDRIFFEVLSAFATVGLTTGITATLPPAALINLIVLMIIGRIGTLTLGSALILKHRVLLYELPKERPLIG
jgi:potassium uptake TrkH family protein